MLSSTASQWSRPSSESPRSSPTPHAAKKQPGASPVIDDLDGPRAGFTPVNGSGHGLGVPLNLEDKGDDSIMGAPPSSLKETNDGRRQSPIIAIYR